MKRHRIVLLLSVLLGSAQLGFAQQMIVRGTITGAPEGIAVYLGKEESTDSTRLEGVHFRFTVPVEAADGDIRYLSAGKGRGPVFLQEPGTVTIEGPYRSNTGWRIGGTPSNDALCLFLQEETRVDEQILALFTQARALDEAARIQLEPRRDSLFRVREGIAARYLKDYKDSAPLFAAFLITKRFYAENEDADRLDSLLSLLGPGAGENILLTEARQRVEMLRARAIGRPARDFAFRTPQGDTLKLSDFRGKYVLLDFWASWCGPCRNENPNLVKQYGQYKEHGFTILSITADQDEQAWRTAIEKDGMVWDHGFPLEPDDPQTLYAVRGIPASFLIDPEGKIVAEDLHGQALVAKLQELFPE